MIGPLVSESLLITQGLFIIHRAVLGAGKPGPGGYVSWASIQDLGTQIQDTLVLWSILVAKTSPHSTCGDMATVHAPYRAELAWYHTYAM